MASNIIIPFQNVPNFRDIAISTSAASHPSSIKPGRFYRSAAPDDATPQDRDRLANEFKIKIIIDLRSDTEHKESKKKQAAKVPPAPDPSKVSESTAKSSIAKIPGATYKLINFNGSAYSSALIWQLSYRNIAKLFAWYSLGWRTDAISVLGENVMSKRGLIGLAEDSLTYSVKEVKEVFDVLADESSYPVLVHCTQGKDRTGLVTLLVLLLLQVPEENIKHDYLLSEEGLAGDREKRMEAIGSIGLTEEFAGCPEDWAETISRWIEDKYGGVRKYLRGCGITDEQMEAVRKIMLAD